MEYLIEHGADINEENENGETPLINVYYSGNKELVQYLVEHGTDINEENKFDETSLINAYYSGNK